MEKWLIISLLEKRPRAEPNSPNEMSSSTTIELTELASVPATQISKTVPNETERVQTTSTSDTVQDKRITAFIVTTITGVTLISSLLSGLVTIGLPAMAKSLNIPPGLLFWSVKHHPLTL